MPQVFQVLRCYKCSAFQVHQVKKSNKWECKLCGEKQSIKRHYGTGTGKDCRLHVQKLNELRGETDKQDSICIENNDCIDNNEAIRDIIEEHTRNSKWSDYVEENSEKNTPSEDDEKETLFGKKVVLEIFKKRKKEFTKNMRKRNIALKKNKYQQYSDEDDICSPIGVSAVLQDTESPKKKRIKFVPPTTKLRSKWTEYNEPKHFGNQTDHLSGSDLSLINKDNELNSRNDLSVNRYKAYKFTIDTTANPTHQNISESEKERNMNIHKPVDMAHNLKSKWDEFTDKTECSQDFQCSAQEGTASVTPSNWFSLCDDNEIDNVLDI